MKDMRFNREEMFLMMIYSPGTRTGLIDELQKMRSQLMKSERRLRTLTDRTLQKLSEITDEEFECLELYPKD